nr:hypothetical protein [Tanacetum cinerariifolium]
MKGIKREFSVAKTPQQNGIAKRKNKTIIKAARTMLADSLLPISFLVEAVNTACYVQNRVLVTKPHNKTPYELLLGKFDGKADEGFLVRYYVRNKAFRVFNSRTKIIQETLHINFLENQPNVVGSGPTWLFDIDTLTQSMNYQPVVAGNQPDSSVDPQNTDADTTFKVKEPESDVHVSPSSSAKTKTHDDKTKRKAKGKNMPALEDITYSDDEEDVGTEANFYNFETNITVSPIPLTRVHKDHHVTQIIGDLSSAPQTRSMTRMVKEKGRLTQINNDDFHTYMFACFLSQEEPKRVHQALKDLSWIKAMHEELLQLKIENVWVLVDLPKGHTQEEGTYYEKVFAPVARIEAIRLFLAYAFFMGFMVYQMDVKSAFLYGTIKEEGYVCHPPRFEDPDYPDKVYKVVKALYGLHQDPKARQDKYVAEILRKFGLTDRKLASTPIDTEKPLLKDPDGGNVDVYTYRYLKGKPHLGLWYPKDSPFNLVAYSDSDYAGASLDRKSTTGGCQFLGCRLISWQCKKQTVVATSSTEAEYVAPTSCCT